MLTFVSMTSVWQAGALRGGERPLEGVAEDGLGAGIKKVPPPERVRGRLNKAGVTTVKYRAQGG